MRILSLSNCPLDESLGSGYVTSRYAQGLRALGHGVDLYGPPEYEVLPRLSRAIRYRQALGMALAVSRRLDGEDYDVVELWGGEAWLAIARLTRRYRRHGRHGRPFLVVSHSNGLETHSAEILAAARADGRLAGGGDAWYHLDHSRLFAAGFRRADALVTVAGFDRDYALRQGYAPPERILALDNPLPDEYLGLDDDLAREPVIGYCGSWIPRKGVDLIARDLPLLLRELPAWKLILVGVGDRFDPAEWFPADVLPRIEVVPFADRRDGLRALYRRFSIAILPSVYESFGLAAAEAMACGCALVASPVGFAAALRHEEEAVLLDGSASPALYRALRRLALDEPLRRSVAAAGRRRVQPLRWTDAVARLAAVYQSWLAELRACG